jgi:beta-lactamase class A
MLSARLLIPAVASAALTLVALSCSSGGETAIQEPTPQLVLGTPAPVDTSTPIDDQVLAEPEGEVLRAPELVSLAWLEQPVDVPPLPAFASPVEDAALLAAVQASLAEAQGRVSVVVHNLADGRHAALAEREVYYAASTFKLGILYEAYRQRDAALLDFGSVLVLDQEYADYDLGTMDLLELKAGDSFTVADALRAMIIVSDTPSAVLLQDTVGGQTADATLRGLGIEDTSFNNRLLPATPADMTILLEAIAEGRGVSPDSRLSMLRLLLQEGYKDGIPAGVPEGTTVAHKTGSYADATHDVALVWGPAGPYVITVMTDQPNNWPLVANVSRAVWDYFASNP